MVSNFASVLLSSWSVCVCGRIAHPLSKLSSQKAPTTPEVRH